MTSGDANVRVVAGRYQLDTVLGRGGMGTVWRTTDTLMQRTVAIKELRAPTGASPEERTVFLDRAMREARHAGRLSHPSIVGVYDTIAAADSDTVYIVMEYVAAPTLADLIESDGPMSPRRTAVVGLGILEALEAAHAIGIVHRDVKPANVLVDDHDRVKLTDFGIALAADDNRLTSSGVIGTQGYLAPECFDTGEPGPASDLWSLGATLFHAVAGRAPFDRGTSTATMRAILLDEIPRAPGDPRLAELIAGLLTRSVEQRYASAEVHRRLRPIADSPDRPPTTAPQRDLSDWERPQTGIHRPGDAPLVGPPPPGFGALPVAAPWARPEAPQSPVFTHHPPPRAPTRQPAQVTPHGPPPARPSRPPQGPPHGPPRPGSPPDGPRRPGAARPRRLLWVAAGVVAVLAVIAAVVVVALPSSKDDPEPGSNPTAAAQTFLEGIRDRDLYRASKTLCGRDASTPAEGYLRLIKVKDFTIGDVDRQSRAALVHAKIETGGRTLPDAQLVVVNDSTDWKVCLTRNKGVDQIAVSLRALGARPPSSIPDTIESDRAKQGPYDVARRYVVGTAVGGDAQTFVYQDTVPSSTTQALIAEGHVYGPGDGDDPGPYTFTRVESEQTVTVGVTKESDGKYWVTKVSVKK